MLWLRSWASHVFPPTKGENGNQVRVVPHDAGAGRERGRRHLDSPSGTEHSRIKIEVDYLAIGKIRLQ